MSTAANRDDRAGRTARGCRVLVDGGEKLPVDLAGARHARGGDVTAGGTCLVKRMELRSLATVTVGGSKVSSGAV